MAPAPERVWLVEAGKLEDRQGTLALETDTLTFTPPGDESVPLRVPVATIVQARRLRGTPVLEVRRSHPEPRILLFYFVKPGPVASRWARRASRAGKRLLGTGGPGRIASMRQLRTAGRALKERIQGWADAIGKGKR